MADRTRHLTVAQMATLDVLKTCRTGEYVSLPDNGPAADLVALGLAHRHGNMGTGHGLYGTTARAYEVASWCPSPEAAAVRELRRILVKLDGPPQHHPDADESERLHNLGARSAWREVAAVLDRYTL